MNNDTNFDNVNTLPLGLYSKLFGVLLAILFIVGLIGNLSVCIVILRNRSMRTVTNCYLFALAISDIVIIVCDLNSWILSTFGIVEALFGRPYCIFEVFTGEIGIHCSLLMVTAVSLTRYIAICRPLLSRDITNDIPKTVKIIIVISIFAGCLSVPSAIRYVDNCNTDLLEFDVGNRYKFIASMWMLFLYSILMTFIGIVYLLLAKKLWRSKDRLARPNKMINEDNRKVVKMLAVVTISLFICWTPLQIFRPIFYYFNMYTTAPQELNDAAVYVEILTGFLFYCVSTTINPIIYNIMSDKFREAFKKTFSGKLLDDQVRPKSIDPKILSVESKSTEKASNVI